MYTVYKIQAIITCATVTLNDLNAIINDKLKFGLWASQYQIQEMEGILKPEAARDMYARATGWPKSSFDLDSMYARQNAINETESSTSRVTEKTSNRPTKTDEQKLASRKRKHTAVDG
jgi:hypothetical protein